MCILNDNGEDDGWQIVTNYRSVWVSFMVFVLYVYILCSKLTNCFISAKQLGPMAAVDASQTTPVQITNVFMFSCCVVLHKLCLHVQFLSLCALTRVHNI